MNELTELCEIWKQAEINYKTAKTSLDNSLEYIITREELKQARFNFDRACRKYILLTIFNEVEEDLCT